MKNNKKVIYIFFTVLCMLVIFTFSSKNSTVSNQTSKQLINKVITSYEKISHKNIDKEELINKLNYPIRKLAHYSIYLILGIFVYNIFLISKIKNKETISIIVCFIYASLDEFHQLFVIGRTAQVKDILIDTLGSITAVIILKYIKNKRNN